MEVLNDSSSSHKQGPFEPYMSSELNEFDSFWDPCLAQMLEPQAWTCLPAAARSCSSTQEASSRTGSPDESFSSGLSQDLLCYSSLKSMPAARALSCRPHIRKCPKRAWTPSTQNALRKEMECLLGQSSLDGRAHSIIISAPSVMNLSLEGDTTQMYTGSRAFDVIHGESENSPLKESHGNEKLPYLCVDSSSKQSFADESLTYTHTMSPVETCTSISLAFSSDDQNSTSNNFLLPSESLQAVAYDQSALLEYAAAAPGLNTWFEDQFAHIPAVQIDADDGNLIDYPKKERSMVNDGGGGHPTYSNNRPAAAPAQGFLPHAVHLQGYDRMPTTLDESIDASRRLIRTNFEDNYTPPHHLAQFCPPKPILGPPHTNNTPQSSLHTLHNGFNKCSATITGLRENKFLGQCTDSRHLSNLYGNASVRSCCSYGSESSVAQPKQISVKKEDGSLDVAKTGEWGADAMNVCVQFEMRSARSNRPDQTGLIHFLAAAAEAVARRDSELASVILGRLKDMVSSLVVGNTMQRVAAYFIHSLEHQAAADGGRWIIDPTKKMKSQEGDILAAFQILHEIFPYIRFGHFTVNQAILEAIHGAKRVHIVDFEIMEGIQWPAFMQGLVSRQGTSSELHITALCRPHREPDLAMVEKTGKRLSEFASSLGLPFTFSLLKTDYDDRFNPKQLKVCDGDTLVVNCMVHLPHMQPRHSMASVASFLQGMRHLSPAIITVVEEELGCSTTNATPSYLSEALYHFHAICDSLEACLPSEVEARMLVERVFMAPRIDSAVAMWSQQAMMATSFTSQTIELLSNKCKWSTAMYAAGFKPRPLSHHSHSHAKLLLGLHRDGFYLEERSHYLVLGWQSKPLFMASVWN